MAPQVRPTPSQGRPSSARPARVALACSNYFSKLRGGREKGPRSELLNRHYPKAPLSPEGLLPPRLFPPFPFLLPPFPYYHVCLPTAFGACGKIAVCAHATEVSTPGRA